MAMFGLGGKPTFCVWHFFFFFWHAFVGLRLLFMHYAWTIATKFDFSPSSQPIRTLRILFTDPQISLFSNFLIKNESHGTIHTIKKLFSTVFFSFQFQFSTVSKRTLYLRGKIFNEEPVKYRINDLGDRNIGSICITCFVTTVLYNKL